MRNHEKNRVIFVEGYIRLFMYEIRASGNYLQDTKARKPGCLQVLFFLF